MQMLTSNFFKTYLFLLHHQFVKNLNIKKSVGV